MFIQAFLSWIVGLLPSRSIITWTKVVNDNNYGLPVKDYDLFCLTLEINILILDPAKSVHKYRILQK